MKKNEFGRDVVDYLASQTERATGLRAAQIAKGMGLTGQRQKRLQIILHELVAAGDIVKLKDRTFSLGEPEQLVTGVVQAIRSGNAFLNPDEGEESVFIYERDLSIALPGDRVLVRAVPPDDYAGSGARRGRVGAGPTDRQRPVKTRSPTGKVLQVIERSTRHVVGLVQRSGKLTYVAPLAPGYRQDFFISEPGKAIPGDRVIVGMSRRDDTHPRVVPLTLLDIASTPWQARRGPHEERKWIPN
jgi:ribonuclease R